MASKASSVPLWLTVGFLAGLGFAWAYLRGDQPAPPQPAAVSAGEAPTQQADAGTLASVEQYFQRWGGYAVWADDVTEIAVWNPRRHAHSDFYEVRYVLGRYYFRTVPRLFRPLVDHGVRTRIPLQFTETQDMHDAFHRAHPVYDASMEPIVDLPPLPPNPRSISEPPDAAPIPGSSGVNPTPPSTPSSSPRLTPGDGY